MDTSFYSFEQWLRQTIVEFDQELEQLALIDERLRSSLSSSSRSPDTPEGDTINQLLSEVKSKAQMLYFYRDLNFFSKRSLPLKNRDVVLPQHAIRELLIQHDAQAKQDLWLSLELQLQPPYIVEHQGISLGITNIELAAQEIKIAFSLTGTISLGESDKEEKISPPAMPGNSLLPVLAGIQLTDDTGVAYSVESPPFFQLPRRKNNEAEWRLNSYMTFTGAVPQQLQELHLFIPSFLLLPTQVFLLLDKEPLVIHGPWEFTFFCSQNKSAEGETIPRLPSCFFVMLWNQ